MSNIRVTYSGLISFVISFSSVITGTIFTLIVTRRLTPEEFGTWSLIGSLITYVTIIEPIISTWATREIARGKESGKTAFIGSGIFSMFGIIAYLIIAYFVGQKTNAIQNTLYLAALLIPVTFLNKTLSAVNLGWKPQAVSYGLISFESSKIPVALLLVYFFNMGISGAIITSVIAYIFSIIVLAFYAREKIKSSLRFDLVVRWIKLSWLSLYPGLAVVAFSLDVTIFSVITSSVHGISYYAAALAIANVVSQSGTISRSIYAKLLEGGKSEYLQENLTQVLYFALPLVSIAIIFSKPALFVLNPLYEVAVPVVIFLSIRTIFYVVSSVLQSSLSGIEKVDLNENSTFKDYMKSKLFLLPTGRLIQYGAYSIFLALGLIFLVPSHTQSELVIYWSIISLVTEIPFTLYMYALARKSFHGILHKKSFIKYLLSSIGVFGITYYFAEKNLIYKNSIFEFFPSFLFFIFLGIGLYLLVTYFIDHRTKRLFKAIIKEITSR